MKTLDPLTCELLGWLAVVSSLFLAVGPLHLTDESRAALDRDQRHGARPPWAGALPSMPRAQWLSLRPTRSREREW